MRIRHTSVLVVLAIVAATILAAIAGSAGAYPTKTNVCTGCHSGVASGTVTATPSTSTPAAGAAYTVAISIGLTSSGNTGYRVAQTNAAGTTDSFVTVYGGPAAQTAWTANMTAPATPGTYYYKAWCVKGPADSAGQAKAALYSITVPATVPTAALTGLSPTSGPVGATLTITGTTMGASGTVMVGGITAATTAWSATSITCTIPAGLAIGAKPVVVTPSAGAASNALTFTVTVPPAPTAALTSVTPNHALAGASVTIAGTNLGSGGTVRFGATTATTTAWSATSVTATVPASLSVGATSVTVTPAGGAASNALAFTVDAPEAPKDTTAPTTTAGGVPAGGWCNDPITVTLAAADNAGGSGVASITYAVDGGAPVTVGDSNALVDLEAHFGGDSSAMQGAHTIAYHATDAAGNAETPQTLTVHHDSIKPSTRAPRAAQVRRHHTAALKYEVRDATPNAGTATVVITIKNRAGKVVKRLRLGRRPVNTPLTARFDCTLRAGAYRFRVFATDAAGNTQANSASQKLTVRPALGS